MVKKDWVKTTKRVMCDKILVHLTKFAPYDRVDNMLGLLMLSIRNHQHHSCKMMQQEPSPSFVPHSMKDVPIVWKGPDWESFLIGLLDAKANFMVVACTCDRKSFKNLFTIMCKLIFVTKIRFEFG
jgi:hypothetical protein